MLPAKIIVILHLKMQFRIIDFYSKGGINL